VVAGRGINGVDRVAGDRRGAVADLQIGQEPSERGREPHWRNSAARYLGPLLLAANADHKTMREVLSWIDTSEQDEPREILDAAEHRYALENLEHVWRADGRYQTSVLGALTTALDAWQEPSVADATSRADIITPQSLCSGRRTPYVVAPASEQRRLQGLFAGLLTHMLDGSLRIAQTSPSERLDPPLLACLDELCNCAPLPELPTYASSGAGQGLLLLSVVQDVAQLVAAFGQDRANTVLSNHRARLFWSGTGDPKTLDYLRGVLGDRQIDSVSRTRGQSSSQTTAQQWRPLLAPHQLRQAKHGKALLVQGSLAPLWLDESLVFDERRLRGRLG